MYPGKEKELASDRKMSVVCLRRMKKVRWREKSVSSPEREGKVATTEVRSTLMQFIKWCGSLV